MDGEFSGSGACGIVVSGGEKLGDAGLSQIQSVVTVLPVAAFGFDGVLRRTDTTESVGVGGSWQNGDVQAGGMEYIELHTICRRMLRTRADLVGTLLYSTAQYWSLLVMEALSGGLAGVGSGHRGPVITDLPMMM